MATEKKQAEKPVSTVSKKNLSNEKNKSKIKLRAKKSNAIKTKTAEKKRQIKRHRNWNSVTIDDPDIQHLLLKKTPRLIKNENELITEFNNYLVSCLEKTRKYKLVPIKTEQVGVDNTDDITEELEEMPTKWKGGKNKVTNNIISQFEIIEGQERGTIPTIWGFLGFLWGIAYSTWEKWRNNEAINWTVEIIDNKLEEIRTTEAAKGNINPSIAALVLNVRYNRIPKKEVDNNIKGSVFKESDFIKD